MHTKGGNSLVVRASVLPTFPPDTCLHYASHSPGVTGALAAWALGALPTLTGTLKGARSRLWGAPTPGAPALAGILPGLASGSPGPIPRGCRSRACAGAPRTRSRPGTGRRGRGSRAAPPTPVGYKAPPAFPPARVLHLPPAPKAGNRRHHVV